MVNNRSCEMPYYALAEIQELVRQDFFISPNLRASYRIEDLGWGSKELKAFLLAIETRHFKKRFPDNGIGGKRRVDCDGYRIRYNEESQSADDTSEFDVFVKLAISPTKNSRAIVVSFHLEGSPG